jgi:hypothetical protein
MFNKTDIQLRAAAWLTVLFSIVSLGMAGAAFAQRTDAEIQAAIENVIMQYHPTDTASWWRSLGPDTPSVIQSMYDQQSFVYNRLRLVQALAWFDDPTATAFLEKVAQDSVDDVIRNGAIQSLGTSQGAREEDFVAGFLTSDDPQTRLVAAQALRKVGDTKAQGYLTRFVADEKVQWVKDKFKNGLLAPAPLRIDRSVAATPVTQVYGVPSPDFAGTWQGVLLVPKFSEVSGVQSYPATLTLAFVPGGGAVANVLRGQLRFVLSGSGKSDKSEPAVSASAGEASFERAEGGGTHFRAEVPWASMKAVANGRAGDPLSAIRIEAELLPEQKGAKLSRVRVLRATLSGIAGVLVLRYEGRHE